MALRPPFEWLVAIRYLREGRLQTALILAGVSGGVAVIIFLTQLIQQLQDSIVERTLGSQAHVVVLPPDEANRPSLGDPDGAVLLQPRAQRLRSVNQWEAVAALAQSMPGVVAVSPMVAGAGFAVRGAASKSIAVLGVDPARYRLIVRMDEYLVAGRFDFTGSQTVIGVDLARDLGVTVGDKLRLVTADGRDETLTIVGLFRIGSRDLDRRWVFVPLKLAQSLLDLPGGVSNVDLRVAEIFDAEEIAGRLAAATGLKVDSWMQTNAQLLSALRNQRVSNMMIRVFVILIVALGIASVLVVSVVQKQREIGILRAMGASGRSILAVFLLQGAIVGLVGSLLGSTLAFGLVQLFSRIYRNADGSALITGAIDPTIVVGACGIALLVGLVSAALPARRAARMDPVQAIRI